MTTVPKYLLAGCRSLEAVSIPSTMAEIGESAFYYCDSLTRVVLPDGLKTIGKSAFRYDTMLSSINFPSKLKTIGDGAFYGDSKLASITFPEGLETIEMNAFHGTGITKITIPSTLKSVGQGWYADADTNFYSHGPFSGCENLTDVTITNGMSTVPAYLLAGCRAVRNITIPQTVTAIGDFAFYMCDSMAAIEFPGSLQSIGESAFENNKSLTAVTLPASIRSIGRAAFYNDTKLKSVSLPEGLKEIKGKAFCYTDIASITIPSTLETARSEWYGDSDTSFYSHGPFANCEHLTEATIAPGMTTIPEYMFAGCRSLKKVTIPATVKKIDDEAFSMCDSLKDVYYGSNQSDWAGITIGKKNNYLTNAAFHYSAAAPVTPQQGDHSTSSNLTNHWETYDGKTYWYEGGFRQGTVSDSKGVHWKEDPAGAAPRGREIYDAGSDAWYWLDSVYDGAKAVGKEVFMPYVYQNEADMSDAEKRSNANVSDDGMKEYVYNLMKDGTGKWVRYDENGMMLKGWVSIQGTLAAVYPDQVGNTYYYDYKTGAMAKGWLTIGGRRYHFDEVSGKLLN